jgi:tetratricopeptide (TPR) repeat protein
MTDDIIRLVEGALAANDPARFDEALRSVEGALRNAPDPWLEHMRGRLLAALGRHDEALGAQLHALELNDGIAAAHYSAGLLFAERGREAEAARHWERAIQLEPRHVDALYNLGQAHYSRGDYPRALALWRAASAVAADDFEIAKKVVQAERALERWDDANRSMQRLFEVWQRSSDPNVRNLHEVVVDQFTVAGRRVLASEMLRPRDPDLYYETTFHVYNESGKAVMTVQLESSQYGREHGVPYLVGINTPTGHESIGPTFSAKPSYRSMKEIAVRVIGERLA